MSTMRVVLTASQASRGHPRAAGATVILLLVAECPSCGRENPGDARFCNACGGALEAVVERGLAQRKVVTILFCDVVGSTALGESTDPEALRARMQRYFADLRA